ncbi:MAG: phage virion morphogenesis protein [Gimesia chilikensis]
MASPFHVQEAYEIGGLFVLLEQAYNEAGYNTQFSQFRRDLQKSHGAYFRSQAGPSGEAWRPLAPSTIKAKGHSRILFRTGRLEKSLKGDSSDSEYAINDQGRGMHWGTSVPYSVFHQRGGGRLPRREHIGATTTQVDALVEKIANAAVNKMEKA